MTATLDSLLHEHTFGFLQRHSSGLALALKKPLSVHTPFSFSSQGKFDDVADKLVERFDGRESMFLLSDASDVDATLSLYGRLAAKRRNVEMPQLLVVDDNLARIQHFLFRYFAVLLNPDDPAEAVLDMDIADGEKVRQYDAQQHLERLTLKVDDVASNRAQRRVVEQVFRNMVNHFSVSNNQAIFQQSVNESMEQNSRTHYLVNPAVYSGVFDSVNAQDTRFPEFAIHAMHADMSTVEGFERLRELLAGYGVFDAAYAPIQAALLPNSAKYRQILPYLGVDTEGIVHVERTGRKQEPAFVFRDSSTFVLQVPTLRGIEKYENAFRSRGGFERAPLRHVLNEPAQLELDFDGQSVPEKTADKRVMFMSNLLVGYGYSDRKAIEDHLDIAVHSEDAEGNSIDTVVLGNAIFGNYFYYDKKMRLLMHPEFTTLDEQLREFARLRGKLAGKQVVYVMGERDFAVCNELHRLYVELMVKEEGRRINAYDLDRQERTNQRWIGALKVIFEDLYPAMVRAGEDLSRTDNEEGIGTRLLDIVHALLRRRGGALPRPDDEALLPSRFLEDSDNFVVTQEHVENGDRSMRVMPNTNFSDVTQYKLPTEALREWVKMSENSGLLNKFRESTLVDMRPSYQMFALKGDREMIWCAGMTDDSRYLDDDFGMPSDKRTKQDPVHKRFTIPRMPNLPGSIVRSGEPGYHAFYEVYFPRVIELMEHVQRTGAGMPRRTFVVAHDNQLGSLTHRLQMMLAHHDFGFHQRGAEGLLGIGDRIHGRNYKDMPNESTFGGIIPVWVQQELLNRLLRPFYTQPHVNLWIETEGNHEWNTDREYAGVHYLNGLEAAITEHSLSTGHEIETMFPKFFMTNQGDVVKGPFAYHNINGYRVLMMHTFMEKFAKGGSWSSPATIPAAWSRSMGREASDYDVLLQGHLHQVEGYVRDNKFHALLGCTAGGSGYEWRRGYGVSPAASLIHFHEDGHFSIEVLSERRLHEHEALNPMIARHGGIKGFLEEQLKMTVYVLVDEAQAKGMNLKPQEVERVAYDLVFPGTRHHYVVPEISPAPQLANGSNGKH